ncbi:Tyrosine recombinase XerC [termite gut metagenome]|uniref:Tyrosine recombinase XerC n=1 Tax=termite gut metagenome TaxID=433724 RepID=A0A5J4R0N5_9ZZZZ
MEKKNNIQAKRRSTYSVMFYINKTKIKKNGMCQVLGRISVDSNTAQIGAKVEISPDLWDAKAGHAIGKSKQSSLVNRTIERLAEKINGYYEELIDKQAFVNAEMIKNALKGIGRKPETLLKLFEEHNEEFAKRIGINRVKESLLGYERTHALLKIFLKEKQDVEDVTLRSLTITFIDAFDLYLRVDRLYSQNTIAGHLINLKKVARRAVSQGTIKRDPFVTFNPEQPAKKCRHLKAEEIDKLMKVHIDDKRIRYTRDMFVFSCFTGLVHVDLKNLKEENLITAEDGSLWIKINRHKTGTESNIRLLDIPRQIIEKYKHERKNDKVFNVCTMSNIGNHFRKLEKMCGIEHITFHMARHNFGTHITLSQGVPIETVSRMMGHSSITTTQLYAQITSKKVDEDMKCLSDRITGKYSMFEDELMPVGISLNQNFKLNDNTVNPYKKEDHGKRKNSNRK